MDERQLNFILTSESERLSAAFKKAAADAKTLDQTIFSLQGTTNKFNASVGSFVDQTGKFITNQAGLNSIGVQTTAQITRQIRVYDELIKRFKNDELVTQQLIRQKQQLARTYGLLDQAATRTGRAVRGNNQIFFQAGQAISDFSIAGIRGAANNIEFLAAQLGAGGPLLIALSLSAAAMFTWGDDIVAALNPVGEAAKETKREIDGMLTVIDTASDRRGLSVFREDLPLAVQIARESVANLERELASLRKRQGGLQGADIFGISTRGLREDLGVAKGILGELEEQLEDITAKERVFGAALENEIIQRNNLLAESARDALRRLDLEKEAGSLSNDRLATLIQTGEFESFINDLLERRNRQSEKNLSLVEKEAKKLAELRDTLVLIGTAEGKRLAIIRQQTSLVQAQIDNRRLKDELEFAQSAESIILARIRSQNKALEEQLKLIIAINEERANPSKAKPAGLDDGSDKGKDRVSGRGQESGLRPLNTLERIGAVEDQRSPEERRLFNAAQRVRDLSPGLVESTKRLNGELAKSTDIILDFGDAFSIGIGNSIVDFATQMGEGARLIDAAGNSLRRGLGSLAIDIGQMAIAEGTAGLAIKAFAENPALAIAAGIGLVAIGRRLQRSAEARTESFFGGGGGRPSNLDAFASNSFSAAQRRFLADGGPVDFNRDPQPDPIGIRPLAAFQADAGRPSIDLNLQVQSDVLANGDIKISLARALTQEAKGGGSGQIVVTV